MFRFVGEFVFGSCYYHILAVHSLCICIACIAAVLMDWDCCFRIGIACIHGVYPLVSAFVLGLLDYVACMAFIEVIVMMMARGSWG